MGLKTFIESSFDEMNDEQRKQWLNTWRYGATMWALVGVTFIICTYLFVTDIVSPETKIEAQLAACEEKLDDAEDACEAKLEATEESCKIKNENTCEQAKTLEKSLCW